MFHINTQFQWLKVMKVGDVKKWRCSGSTKKVFYDYARPLNLNIIYDQEKRDQIASVTQDIESNVNATVYLSKYKQNYTNANCERIKKIRIENKSNAINVGSVITLSEVVRYSSYSPTLLRIGTISLKNNELTSGESNHKLENLSTSLLSDFVCDKYIDKEVVSTITCGKKCSAVIPVKIVYEK